MTGDLVSLQFPTREIRFEEHEMKKLLTMLALATAALVWMPLTAQAKELPDFTELVEKQGATVVNISTTQVIKGRRGFPGSPFGDDEAAQELLRRFFPGQIPNIPGMPQEFKNRSLGSGFIIGADGHILTNAHVVDGADEVLVKLADKREFKAKVLGADKRTDVALIKIEASNLQVAKLGDSAAQGRRMGGRHRLALRLREHRHRRHRQRQGALAAARELRPLHPDRRRHQPRQLGRPAVQPEGRGGRHQLPDLLALGRLMGLSFAIPIDLAMDIQAQLKSRGKVSRGRLGIGIQEVNKELAESFNLSKPQGALVASVEKGAAADKAGIEVGDVILKFDGKTVNESERPAAHGRLDQARQQGHGAGLAQGFDARAFRRGRRDSGRGRRIADGRSRQARRTAANRLGLVLSVPNAEQRKQLGVQHGLIVEDVRNAGTRTELRPAT
jgi:serine protease Do